MDFTFLQVDPPVNMERQCLNLEMDPDSDYEGTLLMPNSNLSVGLRLC